MKEEKILLSMRSINNIMDLANLLKNLFPVKISFFPENNQYRLAFSAEFSSDCLLKFKKKQKTLHLLVFLNGKSRIYEDDALTSYMFHQDYILIDNLEKEINPLLSFESIAQFVEFLKDEFGKFDFPDIGIESLSLINLEERDKRIKAWRKKFDMLIPYGVVVEPVYDTDERAAVSTIFELNVPIKPVPKEIAEQNNAGITYDAGCLDEKSWTPFYPEDDWNAMYKEIVEKLKEIYKIPIPE